MNESPRDGAAKRPLIPFLSAADSEGESLDARIAAAEQAVMRRDQRVLANFRLIRERAGVTGRRHQVLGVGMALMLLTVLIRAVRRHGPGSVAAATTVVAGRSLWHRLSPQRGGPNNLFLSLAVPAMGNYLARRRERKLRASESAGREAPPVVSSAADFDVGRYYGQWYEIARLPTTHEKRCAGDVRALYIPTGAVNCFAIANRCRRHDGMTAIAHGIGRVNEQHPARFKVSFAPRLLRRLPFMWHDYWVLEVDRDYRYALVGTPDRRRLWLLSRTPRMAPEAYDALLSHAHAQGFETSRLLRIAHEDLPEPEVHSG